MYLYIGMYHDFLMDDSSSKFLRIHISTIGSSSLFKERNSTGPFLYLLARQCRIKQLSFSRMAGVHACS